MAHIAGNIFLTVMWEALAFHIRCFLTDFTKDSKARLDALSRHRPLVEAIAAGNSDEARRLGRTHLDACRQHYESRMTPKEDVKVTAKKEDTSRRKRRAAASVNGKEPASRQPG